MAFQWSEQQLLAINTINKNILVSASAGAGKTTVLVARLMKRMLVDHVSIDRIVAMTFTEAAASEMKKRLLESLNQTLHNPTSTKQEREFCANQLILLQNAHISTIHSFCLSIIQSDYAAIGLDPARLKTIFDDAQVSQMKHEAFQLASNQFLENQPEAFFRVAQHFSSRCENFVELQKAVESIAKKALGSANPEEWLTQAQLCYQPVQRLHELPNVILDTFFAQCQTDADILISLANEMKNIATTLENSDKQQVQIQLFLDMFQTINQAIQAQDYREFRRILMFSVERKTSNIKDCSEYNDLRKQFVATCKELVEKYYSEETYLKDLRACHEFASALCQLVKSYQDFYQQKKQKSQGIDFDDMEHLAYQILQADEGRIARKYQSRFDEIMVDEFQDSNDLQNQIIQSVSRGNNVFRVGDVKQSIYKFRGAQPQIMRSLMKADSLHNCTIHLSNNYRSKQMIVDFNNALFQAIMNIKGCSDAYTQQDHVTTGAPAQNEDNHPVEFHTLFNDVMKEEASDEEGLASNELKANYIAQQILQLRQTSKFKQWKDYVVLVRSHGVKTHLKQAFQQANIPFYIDAKEGFYQSDAMLSIVSFLKLLQNPYDSVSMTAVLCSSFYQMDDSQLATLYLQRGKLSLNDILTQLNHPILLDIKQLNQICRQQGIAAMIHSLLQINHYYEQHCTTQQRTNCDLLYQKALLYQQNQGSSLFSFTSMIEQISEEKTSEAIPVGNEDDVVKVMTIHQSKGLQFPVVFYWSTSRISIMDKRESCIVDSDLGFGLFALDQPYRFRRPTLIRQAIEYKTTLEELEENIRILYVALTRAQNKMILVDTVKNELPHKQINIQTLFQKKGTSDLVLCAMSQFTSNFCHIHSIQQIPSFQTYSMPRQEAISLPRYQLLSKPTKLLTPSQTEETRPGSLHPQASGKSASQRGTMLHHAIEILPSQTWTQEMILEVEPELTQQEVQLLLDLSQHPFFQQCQSKNVEKELPFAMLREETLIHGIMDYVCWDDTQVTLIDFKSDQRVTEQGLIDRYHQQIQAYQLCLTELYPNLQQQCFLYSLALKKFIEIKI